MVLSGPPQHAHTTAATIRSFWKSFKLPGEGETSSAVTARVARLVSSAFSAVGLRGFYILAGYNGGSGARKSSRDNSNDDDPASRGRRAAAAVMRALSAVVEGFLRAVPSGSPNAVRVAEACMDATRPYCAYIVSGKGEEAEGVKETMFGDGSLALTTAVLAARFMMSALKEHAVSAAASSSSPSTVADRDDDDDDDDDDDASPSSSSSTTCARLLTQVFWLQFPSSHLSSSPSSSLSPSLSPSPSPSPSTVNDGEDADELCYALALSASEFLASFLSRAKLKRLPEAASKKLASDLRGNILLPPRTPSSSPSTSTAYGWCEAVVRLVRVPAKHGCARNILNAALPDVGQLLQGLPLAGFRAPAAVKGDAEDDDDDALSGRERTAFVKCALRRFLSLVHLAAHAPDGLGADTVFRSRPWLLLELATLLHAANQHMLLRDDYDPEDSHSTGGGEQEDKEDPEQEEADDDSRLGAHAFFGHAALERIVQDCYGKRKKRKEKEDGEGKEAGGGGRGEGEEDGIRSLAKLAIGMLRLAAMKKHDDGSSSSSSSSSSSGSDDHRKAAEWLLSTVLSEVIAHVASSSSSPFSAAVKRSAAAAAAETLETRLLACMKRGSVLGDGDGDVVTKAQLNFSVGTSARALVALLQMMTADAAAAATMTTSCKESCSKYLEARLLEGPRKGYKHHSSAKEE
eukprot:jgi/Bigna1/68363/fgenesh1_pg.6_\